MTQTPTLNISFEEYLTHNDGTDNRYELVDGELVMVPLPTADHSDAIDLLSDTFKAEISRQERLWIVKRDVGVYTGINPVTGKERSRTPDLCVMTQAQWTELKADKTKSAVLTTPPLITVEVVSPGSKKTDYENKEAEYSRLGIPEYWIVDLLKSQVSVLLLQGGRYLRKEFKGSERIVPQIFPEFALIAEQILSV